MSAPQTSVKCLPTYVLIDTSSSMAPAQDVLNSALESLCTELYLSPDISDFAHVSIITFATDAYLVLGMTDIQQLSELPEIQCGGVTNFGAAFELVRSCIDQDVESLRADGRKVLRPVVFLMTDGEPTDENGHRSDGWRDHYARLVDGGWSRHPNVVPFGFGEATADVITAMATNPKAAFLASDPDHTEALRTIFSTLIRTLIASAQNNSLQLPREIGGFEAAVNNDVVGP